VIGASTGLLGNRLTQALWGTSQRANPAMTTPKSRNGIASNSNP
jgi:hypothetical protein